MLQLSVAHKGCICLFVDCGYGNETDGDTRLMGCGCVLVGIKILVKAGYQTHHFPVRTDKGSIMGLSQAK